MSTITLEPPEAVTEKPKNKTQKPWAVIISDDDEHTYQYVIEVLRKVFGYDETKSFKYAEEIDTKGRAIVWSGTREVAELKRDQVKGGGKDFYAGKPVEYPLACHIEEMP